MMDLLSLFELEFMHFCEVPGGQEKAEFPSPQVVLPLTQGAPTISFSPSTCCRSRRGCCSSEEALPLGEALSECLCLNGSVSQNEKDVVLELHTASCRSAVVSY